MPATSGEMERPADGIADEAINEAGCSDENEHEAEASASESNEETSADVEENVGRADAEVAENVKKSKRKKEKGVGAAAFKNSFKTKDFRFGMHSSALTAVVIAAVVVINILAAICRVSSTVSTCRQTI